MMFFWQVPSEVDRICKESSKIPGPGITALLVNHSATKNTRLRWYSQCGQFIPIGHIPGGQRPLLREGGLISYAAPSAALCLRTYGDRRGLGVSYERGTPVDPNQLPDVPPLVFLCRLSCWAFNPNLRFPLVYRGTSLIRPPPL